MERVVCFHSKTTLERALHDAAALAGAEAAGTVDDSPVVHTGLQGGVREKDREFGDSMVALKAVYEMSCVANQFLIADHVLRREGRTLPSGVR